MSIALISNLTDLQISQHNYRSYWGGLDNYWTYYNAGSNPSGHQKILGPQGLEVPMWKKEN